MVCSQCTGSLYIWPLPSRALLAGPSCWIQAFPWRSSISTKCHMARWPLRLDAVTANLFRAMTLSDNNFTALYTRLITLLRMRNRRRRHKCAKAWWSIVSMLQYWLNYCLMMEGQICGFDHLLLKLVRAPPRLHCTWCNGWGVTE